MSFNTDKARAYLQVALLLVNQCSKQFFFAKSLPAQAARLHILSKAQSASSYWLTLILIDVFALRLPTVCFSRVPPIMRESNVPEREELITDILVRATTTKDTIGGVGTPLLPLTAPTPEEEAERAAQFEKAKAEVKKLLGDRFGLRLYYAQINRNYRRSSKRKTCMYLNLADSLCSVPSTAFYIFFSSESLYKSDSLYINGATVLFGIFCGAAAASTYYLFRGPSSVGRIATLQEAWKRDGYSKIDLPAYRIAKAKAWIAGITMFFFSFYGGFHTLERVFGKSRVAVGFSLALSGASSLLAGHTFYRNMLSCLMPEYIKGTNKTTTEETHKSCCAPAVIGAMAVVGALSVGVDGLLSIMSMMFGYSKLGFKPSSFTKWTGVLLAASAILYLVPGERSWKFTVRKCMSNLDRILARKESVVDHGGAVEAGPGNV